MGIHERPRSRSVQAFYIAHLVLLTVLWMIISLIGEETEAEISHFPRTLAYQHGVGKCQCRQPCLSIATTALCHSSGGKPASLSFHGLCLIHKAAALSKLVSWAQPSLSGHHLDASSAGHLSPWKPWLSPRGSRQSFRRAKPSPQLSLGVSTDSQRDSLAVAARSIWKHSLLSLGKQGERRLPAIFLPTPRTSQKSRCPIWDFLVSSLA